ncbi:NAD(P)-dependent oxidoreductase [Rhizobium halophytocola]|uniref:Lactate dehydrogenase-like 2-hydroxyacid dehydrogenase n=1 Tax=Rhizobium halophytocola TaxID=735519 RepID=A0ABS4E5Y7_9HYPH|nr:NAD(P)-dependent oxidoreductase [Rhizobium halophytocola]MBP1853361.1 lactate dehydrogenase-like 2-hydroxyacid dehydrogenase [Rhizobium halophytocola]
MPIDVAINIETSPYAEGLRAMFDVHDMVAGIQSLSPDARAKIEVLVTNGMIGADRTVIEALPKLKLIACVGTGYEAIDVEAARDNGVLVTSAAGANAPAVADHAMGLLLSLVRDIPRQDSGVRAGTWRKGFAPRPMLTGKTIGIAGLGDIGSRIARRAEAFDMEVLYFTRRPRPDAPWGHVADLKTLAERADVLMTVLPGGAATHHLVDSAVLAALGPKGYLVNVGRGNVVDTDALITALETNAIAGAALDVFETEPQVPEALFRLANLVMTPHMAGISPEVQAISLDLVARNIRSVMAGDGPLTPVPECAERSGA